MPRSSPGNAIAFAAFLVATTFGTPSTVTARDPEPTHAGSASTEELRLSLEPEPTPDSKAPAEAPSIDLDHDRHEGEHADDASPRAAALRREIANLEQEKASISSGGSVAAVVIGGLGFLLLTPPGVFVLALGCGLGPQDGVGGCDGFLAAGLALTGLGLLGGIVSIIGLVNVIEDSNTRRDLDRRINQRHRDLERLSLDLRPREHGAEMRLVWRF